MRSTKGKGKKSTTKLRASTSTANKNGASTASQLKIKTQAVITGGRGLPVPLRVDPNALPLNNHGAGYMIGLHSPSPISTPSLSPSSTPGFPDYMPIASQPSTLVSAQYQDKRKRPYGSLAGGIGLTTEQQLQQQQLQQQQQQLQQQQQQQQQQQPGTDGTNPLFLEDDEDELDPPKRPKFEIKLITDKQKRHITFSKRKAGLMKKAYELSILTGTQVMLLVASENGHVYTYATDRFQTMLNGEGAPCEQCGQMQNAKNLIQACLTADDDDQEEEVEEEPLTAPHIPPSATLNYNAVPDLRLLNPVTPNVPSPLTSPPTLASTLKRAAGNSQNNIATSSTEKTAVGKPSAKLTTSTLISTSKKTSSTSSSSSSLPRSFVNPMTLNKKKKANAKPIAPPNAWYIPPPETTTHITPTTTPTVRTVPSLVPLSPSESSPTILTPPRSTANPPISLHVSPLFQSLTSSLTSPTSTSTSIATSNSIKPEIL